MSGSRRRRRSWRDHLYPLRFFAGALPEAPAADAMGWRSVSAGEAEAWVAGRTLNPNDREMYRVALENRHTLLLAELDGREVARRWVGSGWAYLSEPFWSLVRFPDGLAYFYDIEVERAYRGRGIGSAGVAAGLRHARSAGLRSCAAYVLRYNLPSLRNWMALGLPWFDATRVVVSYRGLWLPRRPWPRLGVSQVVPRRPPA
jgi:GNAT superfamily N-acetyltransferase